jgi:alanyl-tRNA synthetase
MEMLSSSEIRSRFLTYFKNQDHRIVNSYPLVPPNDPTLLFTNAGMVQFKDVFTGKERSDFKRATSSQKCLRAGGKHNDLENVGYTARHHTFFEMLGNFSFGDYFKREAIRFAWEFLTDVVKLPPEHLYVTVFGGDTDEHLPADDEAAEYWRAVAGIRPERILRFGKKDNFWSMGDTGPCGPCSEILFDQSDRVPCSVASGCRGPGCDCDRYMEIWNLVFMQFERKADGALTKLPAPSIDTGMGLERLSAIVQGVTSNYQADLFTPLIKKMATISGSTIGVDPTVDISLRVVADHARASAFLLADGVLPSNEGRGYVLRRIMRRAIRHGSKLGVNELFFHQVCLTVVEIMSSAYPELSTQRALIEQASKQEEETFRRTLDNGLRLLEKEIKLRGSANAQAGIQGNLSVLPGKLVFDLQTRDGFPPDLTAVIAKEHGFVIDQAAYQQAWEQHQEVSGRGLGLSGVDDVFKALVSEHGPTTFTGYEGLEDDGEVLAILEIREAKDEKGRLQIVERRPTETAETGMIAEVITSRTPLYGESGGQIGDTGFLNTPQCQAEVEDSYRPLPDLTVHRVRIIKGELRPGDRAHLRVDSERRQAIRLNHSATHLLQAALRQVLGAHINQKGSLVAPERLRFDFSHFAPLSDDELLRVEAAVNERIRRNNQISVSVTDIADARTQGATMLFGEKYGEKVRIVHMGDSLELCGGTHAKRTGDIGLFLIESQSSVQSGVRRIEAVTGMVAIKRIQKLKEIVHEVEVALKVPETQVLERVKALIESERKRPSRSEEKLTVIKPQEREIAGVKVLFAKTKGVELADLRAFADKLRDQKGGGVVLASAEEEGKISLVCSVSKELTNRVRAGDVLKTLFSITGGRGGGRADFAQGGGGDPALLDTAIEAFYNKISDALGNG